MTIEQQFEQKFQSVDMCWLFDAWWTSIFEERFKHYKRSITK